MCGIRIKIWGDEQTGDKKYGGSILHVAKKVLELTFHCLMNEDEISNCWKGECFKIPIVSASKYPWDSILQVKCIEYFQTRTWEIKLNLKSTPVSGFLLQLSPPPLKWIRTATWELTMVKPRCRYCSAQLGPFVSESTYPWQSDSIQVQAHLFHFPALWPSHFQDFHSSNDDVNFSISHFF